MELRIEEERTAAAVLLRLRGGLDYASSSRLQERVASLLEEGCLALYLDLRGVMLLDSTGLGLLVWSASLCRKLDRSLTLVAPGPAVCTVLEVSRLGGVFRLLEDEPALRRDLERLEGGDG
jgi:anti-anti-sigma factor